MILPIYAGTRWIRGARRISRYLSLSHAQQSVFFEKKGLKCLDVRACLGTDGAGHSDTFVTLCIVSDTFSCSTPER